MPTPITSPGVTIISEMITPAILILASGSLLNTVLARLGRVVEHFRKVQADVGKDPTLLDARTKKSLQIMERRADKAEISMACYFTGVCFFVSTCLMIAIQRLANNDLFYLPVATSIAGAALLLAGSAYMLAESRLAVAELKLEMRGLWDDKST